MSYKINWQTLGACLRPSNGFVYPSRMSVRSWRMKLTLGAHALEVHEATGHAQARARHRQRCCCQSLMRTPFGSFLRSSPQTSLAKRPSRSGTLWLVVPHCSVVSALTGSGWALPSNVTPTVASCGSPAESHCAKVRIRHVNKQLL